MLKQSLENAVVGMYVLCKAGKGMPADVGRKRLRDTSLHFYNPKPLVHQGRFGAENFFICHSLFWRQFVNHTQSGELFPLCIILGVNHVRENVVLRFGLAAMFLGEPLTVHAKYLLCRLYQDENLFFAVFGHLVAYVAIL